jgi:hypothetical protein
MGIQSNQKGAKKVSLER